MLCSHTTKFIYLKTMKTAGTSTEIFFEKYCCPAPLYIERHETPEVITEDGVIGYRGGDPSQSRFFHHMPASLVRDRLGSEIWETYFKFCVTRNPFDKTVSMFWMQLSAPDRERLATAPFADVQEAFSNYVGNGGWLPVDRDVYTIDGRVVVDFFIRFEHLVDDIHHVCRHLDISTPAGKLSRYKTEYRQRSEPFQRYYDASSEAIVRVHFDWEIKVFDYRL